MHPRLITTLILLDPVVHRLKRPNLKQSLYMKINDVPATTSASSYRRDLWPSRKAAEDAMRQSSFYQRWDPRVFARWIHYGLRDLPTAIYPQIGRASCRERV